MFIADMQHNLKKLINRFSTVLEEIPELVYIGDGVLRQKSQEVSFEEGLETGEKLIDVLGRYRKLVGFGRGLAAPQIGESKSVFVAFIDDKFKIYINPSVINKSDRYNFFRESCLSCGCLSADVKRPESVTVRYTNENNEESEETYDGFVARLIQHECDHLIGVVNIDKAEPASIEFQLKDPLSEQLREL